MPSPYELPTRWLEWTPAMPHVPLKQSTIKLYEHDRRIRNLERGVRALAAFHLHDAVDPVGEERRNIALRRFMAELQAIADDELTEAEL